jgi:hypothetical protein
MRRGERVQTIWTGLDWNGADVSIWLFDAD